jgi:hypothetical protein
VPRLLARLPTILQATLLATLLPTPPKRKNAADHIPSAPKTNLKTQTKN